MMSTRYVPALLFLFLSTMIAPVPAASAAPSSHALLIGVEDYSGTGLRSLEGPRNDIALVQTLLESRFGLPKENILTLVDARATHSGIQKGFARLAKRVQPGDFVYIQYSGHGSYAEDKNGDERSGKDQTWVSFGARSGDSDGIDDHDVLDDEINEWLMPLYEKTDRVVFVSDSCHSASVSKGELRGRRAVPQDLRTHPLAEKRFKSSAAPGIRVGSARDAETAIELRKEGKSYGLFSWYWVQALNQARPGETWDDAFKRAYALVTTQRGAYQQPQLEGHGDRAVFGGRFAALQTTVAVTTVDEQSQTVRLAVGSVSGATTKSLYRLYEPGKTQDDAEVPTLELLRVRAYSSDAVVRQGGFKVGDLVVEAQHAYPFEPLRLAVEGDYASGQDKHLVARIERAVKALEGFELVRERSRADWIVYLLRPKRTNGDYECETERATLPKSFPDQDAEVWVINTQEEPLHDRMKIPLKDPDKGLQVLTENLKKFARVRELKRLASRSGPPPVAVTTTVLRPVSACTENCVYLPDEEGEEGEEQAYRRITTHDLGLLPTDGAKLGDVLHFHVKNDANRDYYIYLLNISPGGGIHAIFPYRQQRKEHALVAAGASRDLGRENWLLLNAGGKEAVKVIASSEPIDLRLFEAEGYAEYRITRNADMNPLNRLLAEAMFTRGKPMFMRDLRWGTLLVEFAVTEPQTSARVQSSLCHGMEKGA